MIPISSAEVSSIFEQNVERMIEAARRNGIKIAFLRNAMNPKFRDVLSIPPVTISSKSFGEEAKRAWGLNYANGIQNMKEGKWQEALRDFERVRGLCPTCHDSLLLLYQGRCLEELGHYEEARREYESRFPAEDLELNDILDRLTRKQTLSGRRGISAIVPRRRRRRRPRLPGPHRPATRGWPDTTPPR